MVSILATVWALLFLQTLSTFTLAMPAPTPVTDVQMHERTTPYFPEYPPSCPKCQAEFDNINSCAEASEALADPQSVGRSSNCLNEIQTEYPVDYSGPSRILRLDQVLLYRHVPVRLSSMRRLVNPFLTVPVAPKLTSTPSFVQTNQTAVLDYDTADLPSVVSGMRQVCSLASTLLGGVASANSQVASSTFSAPTASATSGALHQFESVSFSALVLLWGVPIGLNFVL
ncbi:hypothetical protein FRC12_024051 [Ceratobasidium sp. 428]|nr:hypothetical protein FRC12_024051 [Ceratobasidium sp. 428]